jgi:DNA-binding GntR family transcriptional regulator
LCQAEQQNDGFHFSPRSVSRKAITWLRSSYEAIKSRKAEKAYRLMNDHVLDVLRHLDT